MIGRRPTNWCPVPPPANGCQWCDAQGRPAVLLTKRPTGEDTVLVDYSTLRQPDVERVGGCWLGFEKLLGGSDCLSVCKLFQPTH